jgi:hypothetical protein
LEEVRRYMDNKYLDFMASLQLGKQGEKLLVQQFPSIFRENIKKNNDYDVSHVDTRAVEIKTDTYIDMSGRLTSGNGFFEMFVQYEGKRVKSGLQKSVDLSIPIWIYQFLYKDKMKILHIPDEYEFGKQIFVYKPRELLEFIEEYAKEHILTPCPIFNKEKTGETWVNYGYIIPMKVLLSLHCYELLENHKKTSKWL